MNFDDVQTFGAQTEIALDNAYEQAEQAVTDVPVADDEFAEIKDAYQEAKSGYGEAVRHAHEAAEVVRQDDFGENQEEVEEAVEHIMQSRDIAEDARYAAHRMVDKAYEHSKDVDRAEKLEDTGFPVKTPSDHVSQARNYVEDAGENYNEAASTVEIGISDHTDIEYHSMFGLGGAPEGFDI